MTTKRWFLLLVAVIGVGLSAALPTLAQAQGKTPNVVVIMMCVIRIHRFN